MQDQPQILPAAKIDRHKWDACVQTANNGLIYARCDYLDHCCDSWYGLVFGDYASVVPLPLRRKLGIRYYYQPPFVQQLGLIGDAAPSDIMAAILQLARYGDIQFNFANAELAVPLGAETRTNLVIDLSPGYERIASAYKKDLVLNLSKAAKSNLVVDTAGNIQEAIELYHQLYGSRTPQVKPADYKKFTALCEKLATTGNCFVRRIVDAQGRLMATGVFLKGEKRIYNMMNSTTAEGRAQEANHWLIDAVIREFAGQQLLFDFEGSDLPGVKAFYEKFGAVNQPYYSLHFNRFPFPLRLLKR